VSDRAPGRDLRQGCLALVQTERLGHRPVGHPEQYQPGPGKADSSGDRRTWHHQMGFRGCDLIKAWAFPVLLALVALALDAADRRVPFTVLTGGALDEGAHLATGALGLLAVSCFIDVPRRFYVAGLIAPVAIDLDHIPMYLGVGNPDERPVTHSLTTVVVVLIAAVASRRHRAVLAGVATGLLIHFARDIVEGPPGCGCCGHFQTRRGRPASGGSWE
jgi:hypothetical protein